MTRRCKRCGREIVKDATGFWKDFVGVFPHYCGNNWERHEPEEKKTKCENCGREIVKDYFGVWRDLAGRFPYHCNTINWTEHKPKKKKAKCKYCGRSITKKGKNWKDNTGVMSTECWNDILNLNRKHKPTK